MSDRQLRQRARGRGEVCGQPGPGSPGSGQGTPGQERAKRRQPGPGHPLPPAPKRDRPGLLLLGSGTLFASMILSGFIIGYWVDTWLDTKPLFMLVFSGLGLVGGMLKVCKLLS